MANKNIFITGATRNTGRAIAETFAKDGYDVIVSSRDVESATVAAKEIEAAFGTKCMGVALDLTDVKDIERVFGEIEAAYGKLDAFVANSANLGVGKGALNTTPEEFDDIMTVNARGTFFCCQKAAEIMKRTGGGNIVTVGSVQATAAVRGRLVYSMSKAAMSAMVKNMAFELGEYNIRVNNLVAGAIHSTRWDDLDEETKAARRSRYPVGRESTEQEIANGVYFLGSDMSSSTTGIDLLIDSGISICLLPYEKEGK